jgi:hypothetical protein
MGAFFGPGVDEGMMSMVGAIRIKSGLAVGGFVCPGIAPKV